MSDKKIDKPDQTGNLLLSAFGLASVAGTGAAIYFVPTIVSQMPSNIGLLAFIGTVSFGCGMYQIHETTKAYNNQLLKRQPD